MAKQDSQISCWERVCGGERREPDECPSLDHRKPQTPPSLEVPGSSTEQWLWTELGVRQTGLNTSSTTGQLSDLG